MKLNLKGTGTILKKTFKGWNEDDPFRQSAVIAYYAIFSLPALLVLLINVVGLFFGREAVNGEISRQISGVMGDDTAKQVEQIIAKASETKAGVISTIIAVVTLLFGATGVFIQLQKTLNQIWDVEQKPNQGFLVELRHRLFSFGLILSIGFLMLISLVVSSGLAAFSHYLESRLPEAIAYLFYALEFIFSLAVISTMFLLMFKFLPDVRMKWRYLITGAVLTGLLFMLGKYGLSFYFGKAEPASAYGAAGSIILILLWVSYSSMIVFFGAEFTKQFAVYHGAHIEPTKIARKIEEGASRPEMGRESTAQKHDGGQEHEGTQKKSNHHINKATMKETNKRETKLNSLQDIEDEIMRLEGRAELDKLAIREQLKPARVVRDILQKKKVIPRPSNPQLAMEGFDFAINFLVDRVILKKASPTVRTLAVFVMREISKNYVYGKSENFGEHLKEVLNVHPRGENNDPSYKRMDDPIDEYYENL
jgi:membrane protein